MDKFGRAYILEVQRDDGTTLTIKLPFTIEFDITRNTLTSANVCQIRVYNLSEKNRNLIRFNVSDYTSFKAITLKAGYGTNLSGLPIVFTGNISEAWSVREGTNFITQIEGYDGGFAFNNGTIDVPFPEGTSNRDLFATIAGQLPHVSVGAIGNYPGNLTRANSHSGNAAQILREITGNGFFIDNAKANVLLTDEYIADIGGIFQINAQSGLLGTPVLEKTIVHFDMIFEPGLTVAQKIFLSSSTGAPFNGDYKVTAVKHRGMISEAVCGEVITTGEFFYSKILTPVSAHV